MQAQQERAGEQGRPHEVEGVASFANQSIHFHRTPTAPSRR